MADRDPESSALAPFYPSEIPSVPGNGRKWFAVLMTLMLLTGVLFSTLALLAAIWDGLTL